MKPKAVQQKKGLQQGQGSICVLSQLQQREKIFSTLNDKYFITFNVITKSHKKDACHVVLILYLFYCYAKTIIFSSYGEDRHPQ
jgi:hypothetical protein